MSGCLTRMVGAALLVWALCAASAHAQEPPPGERGRWVHGLTMAVQMEATLEEHGSVRWMTEDRFQFIVTRLSVAEARAATLERKVEALEAENASLERALRSQVSLAEVRLRYSERLEVDLERAENTLTRLPKRKKLWVITGAILGGSAVYFVTR